jgi:hypothetical protein
MYTFSQETPPLQWMWSTWGKLAQASKLYSGWKARTGLHKPLRGPGGWDSQNLKTAREGGKIVSPKHRPPLPLIRKLPLNLSGIEPATFRRLGQWLNRLRHGVPHSRLWMWTETVRPEVYHILQPLRDKCKWLHCSQPERRVFTYVSFFLKKM